MKLSVAAFVLGFCSPQLFAQARPAWLDRAKIKVEVLDDAGRMQGPRVEIKRGDRVRIRAFQGRGVDLLKIANRELTEEVSTERAEACEQAHDFDWVVRTDVSLTHVKRLLKPIVVDVPKAELSIIDKYRVPRGILLEVNGQAKQPYPPRVCTSLSL